jgi:hypothetical protein
VGLELDAVTIVALIVAGSVGFAALAVAVLRRERSIWILGAMLFASCLAIGVEPSGKVIIGRFYLLQTYRSELFLVLGAALGLHTLFFFRQSTGRLFGAQTAILTLMAFLAATLRFIHEGGQAGVESLVYACATMIPLLLVPRVLVQNFSDPLRIFRMAVFVNLLWVAGVAVQVLLDPSKVVLGREDRFIGLLGNPQHAGSLMAVFVAVALYLFLNDPLRRYRWVWIGLIGVDVVLLGWTGSRTGLGMAVLAVSGVLYSRVGRAILWLPTIALLVFVAFAAVRSLGLTIGFERLVSSENTRAAAWSNLLQNGLSSPIIGSGVEGAGDSENGYLYGFAAYGFGMVMLVLALIAATAHTSLQLWRIRRHLSVQYRSMCDLLIGYFALYFGGSVFEGYMMARVAANLTFFMLFAGLAARLIQMTDEALAADQVWQDDPAYDEQAQAGEPSHAV